MGIIEAGTAYQIAYSKPGVQDLEKKSKFAKDNFKCMSSLFMKKSSEQASALEKSWGTESKAFKKFNDFKKESFKLPKEKNDASSKEKEVSLEELIEAGKNYEDVHNKVRANTDYQDARKARKEFKKLLKKDFKKFDNIENSIHVLANNLQTNGLALTQARKFEVKFEEKEKAKKTPKNSKME